jgi:hypothetical protein
MDPVVDMREGGGAVILKNAEGRLNGKAATDLVLVLLTFGIIGCGRFGLDGSNQSGAAGGEQTVISPDEGQVGSIVCAGVTCLASQICCIANGTCVDQATAASTCPKSDLSSTTETPVGTSSGTKACGSNADCDVSEFCKPGSGCLGAGTCTSRQEGCGFSFGAMGFCGCDGVTYPTIQAACLAGVSTLGGPGGCGVAMDTQFAPGASGAPRDPIIYCGFDRQCPTGDKCCAITGRCYDGHIPYLCSKPPPGTMAPCLEDRQCAGGEYCSGDGCSGPGGCIIQGGECDGQLKPVCGCDGNTYTSATCLRPLGVRAAHSGVCGDGGADASQ